MATGLTPCQEQGSVSERGNEDAPTASSDEVYAPRAIQLVRVDGDRLLFTEEGRLFLSSLKAPIGVISVVGQQKSGKSFFCNRVLLDLNSSGFAVASTTASCTEGIWVWDQPKQIGVNGKSINCIVLDTQGTGSVERDSTQDVKILSLVVLLSSYLIFNSVGNLNDVVMHELSVISQLSLHICDKANEQGDVSDQIHKKNLAISKHFPSLLWVLRDFALELVDEAGNTITPYQYLEFALSSNGGAGAMSSAARDEINEKNRLKASFRDMFIRRDCATLRRPVEEEAKLHRLQLLSWEELRPDFARDVQAVRERIWAGATAKAIDGRLLDGPALALLLERYAEALGSGDCVSISDSLSQVPPPAPRHAALTAARPDRRRPS